MIGSSLSFSVIIPAYNRADVLGRAIRSVLEQDYPVDEIIVVDDGSQEDLRPVVAPFGEQVRLIRQDNAGAAAARNTGISHASSTWLTFLDSDDFWLPGRMSRLASDLEGADPDIVAHIGDVCYAGPGYRQGLFAIKGQPWPSGPAQPCPDPLELVISGMSLCGAAIRREAFHAAGGFDPALRMLEDTDLFCQLAIRGKFLVTGDMMVQAERVADDTVALTRLEQTEPLATSEMHVHYLEKLIGAGLTPAQRQLVRRKLSGALLIQANAEFLERPKTTYKTLWRAARIHPNPLKGWAKTIAAAVMGPAAIRRMRQSHLELDRG